MNEFISLTDLGRLYGVSSHKVGKWLKELGLRTRSGDPSPIAFADGMVEKCNSTQPGTYFYLWHFERTTAIFDGMCYPRAVLNSHEQQTDDLQNVE